MRRFESCRPSHFSRSIETRAPLAFADGRIVPRWSEVAAVNSASRIPRGMMARALAIGCRCRLGLSGMGPPACGRRSCPSDRAAEARRPGGPARPYSAVKAGRSGCPCSIPPRGQKARRFRKRPPQARSRRAGSIHSGSAPSADFTCIGGGYSSLRSAAKRRHGH